MMKKKTLTAWLLALGMTVALTGCGGQSAATSPSPEAAPTAPANPTIRLSTTTSVNDSGLLGALQPAFEADTGYKLEITSKGSGAAIALGESGDADCLLVHSPAAEEEFVQEGYGVERIPFMYNYFVIVGPKDDPAGVAQCQQASEAFKAIAQAQVDFISRGDESGTHKKELEIWETAGIDPEKESYYISTGLGMGDCLTQANERKGYVLTDKATYLSMKDNLPELQILLERSDEMMNTYSLIEVNKEKNANVNNEGAEAFIAWMTSDKGKQMIAEYGQEEYGESLFFLLEEAN